MLHVQQLVSVIVSVDLCNHLLFPWSTVTIRLEFLGELSIKTFTCYEAKIEESEKADSHQGSNPGDLA